MKNIKILLTLMACIFVLAGCASNSARQADADAQDKYYGAQLSNQQTAELSTISRAEAAVQTIEVFDPDDGSLIVKATLQGNYEEAEVLNIQAPPSEVQTMINAQQEIIPAAINGGVELIKTYNNTVNAQDAISSNERIANQRILADIAIEESRNNLLSTLATPAVPVLPVAGSTDTYPCPVRSDAGEFVAGSPTDGWGESAVDGPCVTLTNPTTPDDTDTDPMEEVLQ